MSKDNNSKKIAVILLRGLVGVKSDIKDTLRMLNLQKKNACVILDDTLVVRGMLKKCENYITYGEVSDEVMNELKEKRPSAKKFYSLHPPRGGFERKGIKKPFNLKGALGYRRDNINVLIKKMI